MSKKQGKGKIDLDILKKNVLHKKRVNTKKRGLRGGAADQTAVSVAEVFKKQIDEQQKDNIVLDSNLLGVNLQYKKKQILSMLGNSATKPFKIHIEYDNTTDDKRNITISLTRISDNLMFQYMYPNPNTNTLFSISNYDDFIRDLKNSLKNLTGLVPGSTTNKKSYSLGYDTTKDNLVHILDSVFTKIHPDLKSAQPAASAAPVSSATPAPTAPGAPVSSVSSAASEELGPAAPAPAAPVSSATPEVETSVTAPGAQAQGAASKEKTIADYIREKELNENKRKKLIEDHNINLERIQKKIEEVKKEWGEKLNNNRAIMILGGRFRELTEEKDKMIKEFDSSLQSLNNKILSYKQLIYLIENRIKIPEEYDGNYMSYIISIAFAELLNNNFSSSHPFLPYDRNEKVILHKQTWIDDFNRQQKASEEQDPTPAVSLALDEHIGGHKSRRQHKPARKTRRGRTRTRKSKPKTHRRKRHSRVRVRKHKKYTSRRR